jgi:hypothetical protein
MSGGRPTAQLPATPALKLAKGAGADQAKLQHADRIEGEMCGRGKVCKEGPKRVQWDQAATAAQQNRS